ncbi:MAG: J domain-containing protein [Croceibacterium sp.]
MGRLILIAVLVVIGFKMVTGRWPWMPKISTHAQALFNARQLLGTSAGASREEILLAHKRLVAAVHPDRGGSNAQVHEASAARDLLLEETSRLTNPEP